MIDFFVDKTEKPAFSDWISEKYLPYIVLSAVNGLWDHFLRHTDLRW